VKDPGAGTVEIPSPETSDAALSLDSDPPEYGRVKDPRAGTVELD
jgi:hypothetical protein